MKVLQLRSVDLSELKRIQLKILDVVSEYCDNNGIKYWLDTGTLLGAIRHNGYIPWDDDIDIGMLRPDFDRFIRTFNGSQERYRVRCIDNDPEFYYVFAKVLDTETVLYEPDEKGMKLSINIDVFVYDNAPDNDKLLNKAYNLRDFYRDANILRNLNSEPSGGFLRKCVIRMIRGLLKPFPKDFFIKRMAENAKRYNGQITRGVANFTSYARIQCDKSVFETFIDHDFEGRKYKIPIGYDQWLRSFYGDYMQLPPVEKRVSHHKFVAFLNE